MTPTSSSPRCTRSKTGGKKLTVLLDSGIPFKRGMYLNTYDLSYNMVTAGTINARIDNNNNKYVTKAYEK